MPRFKFTIAYDGKRYSGWQKQQGNITIQECVEKALARLAQQDIRIHGSGRTDAGVHALGQVFHADIPAHLSILPANFPRALNSQLPPDIRILKAELVTEDFHARFSAQGKTYRYALTTTNILFPQQFQRAGHYPYPLDSTLFCETIATFTGTHNFASFAAVRGSEPTPLPKAYYERTITQAQAKPTEDGFLIEFTGTGFLYKMVRLMIGTALAVASHKLTPSQFQQLLHAPTEQKSRHCASPYGLTLYKVHYPEH